MSNRTEYQREYYARNAEKRASEKQQARDDFDLATTYWRQKMLFGNDMPNLIARISEPIVERARIAYEKVLAEYEPEDVAI